MNYRCIFLLLIFYSPYFFGQDVHWSLPLQNPIGLNPSNVGDFKGDFRIISNYKDQWRSVTKPFNTINLGFDKKINKLFSLGSTLTHDITGDGKYRTIDLNVLPSYSLIAQNNKKLSLGISLGIIYKQITPANFKFDNQFDGYMYQENLSSNEAFQSVSQLNMNIGAGLSFSFNQHTIGCSFFNLNQPNQGFFNSSIKRPIRFLFNYQTLLNQNGRFQYTPSFVVQKQSVYTEVISGLKSSYQINNKKLKSINLGLNVRFKDAVIPYIGLEFNNLQTGIGYDINTSSLKLASRSRGGTELYLQYIFVKQTIKNLEHRKCKDFL